MLITEKRLRKVVRKQLLNEVGILAFAAPVVLSIIMVILETISGDATIKNNRNRFTGILSRFEWN